MNIEELAQKVQRLSDLEEIRTLRAKYSYVANIIDGVPGGPDKFAALFAEDGTVDFGASDAPMKPEEVSKVARGVLQIPMTAGANAPKVQKAKLRDRAAVLSLE